MITSNIHSVTSLTAGSSFLPGTESWITDITAITKDGEHVQFTFFSKGPLEIKGAEFVNHCASDEKEPLTVGVFEEIPS